MAATEEDVRQLPGEATSVLRERVPQARCRAVAACRATRSSASLAALVMALSGLRPETYITSRSRSGVVYEIAVDGPDITCSCPVFGYRGQCSHVREFRAQRRKR